ncbi:MAG: glycosyltransferase family 9 protein [Bacteroidia bacterium]
MNFYPKKILIIQTAFIGDAILATSVAEELHHTFPDAQIFMLVKKGNESLFDRHPFLKIWTHDKSRKYYSLLRLIKTIRKEKFDVVINLHRYLSSNILTLLSNARFTAGFQSPLSFMFSHRVLHHFKKDYHEIHRYHDLTFPITRQEKIFLPKLYPSIELPKDFLPQKKYVCFFPGSVWATKQLPPDKWIALARRFSNDVEIYLCGSKTESSLCEYIKNKSERNNVFNIAGQYSLFETMSIVRQSQRVYTNDSAPLHIASALNIPVTAFFCSTVKDFGFYPLSEDSEVLEVENLDCRPCGIHGKKQCPKHHFRCGLEIDIHKAKVIDKH